MKLNKIMIIPSVLLMLAGTGLAGTGASAVSASHVKLHHHVRTSRMSGLYRQNARALQAAKELRFAKKAIGLRYSITGHDYGSRHLAAGHYRSRKSKTDTSGYVWAVMKHSGFKVSRRPYITPNMMHYFKRISAKNTKPGDVVDIKLHGSYMHSAILLQRWHGKQTKIIEMGGSKGDVNISTYGNAIYGHSKQIFGRPVK